jgi:hypothetical protein
MLMSPIQRDADCDGNFSVNATSSAHTSPNMFDKAIQPTRANVSSRDG